MDRVKSAEEWMNQTRSKTVGNPSRLFLSIIFLALSLSSGACTTSSTSEEGGDDAEFADEVAIDEVSTDAVPGEAPAELAADETPPPDESVDAAIEPPPAEPEVAEVQPPEESPAPVMEAAAPSEPVAPVAAIPSGEFEDYAVAPGDTLMKIAFERYGDLFQWRKIASDNAQTLKDPNVLPVGFRLKLERATTTASAGGGERFLSRKGDTLGTISNEIYGSQKKWRKLWDENKELIRDPNRIFAGFYLRYLFSDQDRVEKEGASSLTSKSSGSAGRMPASK